MVWWEIVFMMVVLKIPIVYLCLVVWWAIRAEPLPDDGGEPLRVAVPDDDGGEPGRWWRPSPARRSRGPHGSPVRVARRAGRASLARGKVER